MANENATSTGNAAEDVALAWLIDRGLEIVERNFRCKMGEIDLIMIDGNTLVFVEVRLRNNRRHLTGAESITSAKIRRLIRTAQYFLQTHPRIGDLEYRFDVMSMGSTVDWIQDAFTLDG